MANVSAQEQLMLELINRARMDPNGEAARYGIALNAGLSAGKISAAPKQVLAMNDKLVDSANAHSQWMLDTDTFSHTGAGGSNAGARMKAAGYAFSGSWGWGENISYRGSSRSIDATSAIVEHHKSLFLSPGHRTNILKDSYKEIGIGQQLGQYGGHNASMVTQNFAYSGGAVFVTGVVYDDTVAMDDFYSVGEGKGGVTVSSGGKSDVSSSAGGYELAVAAGPQTVSIGNAKVELTTGSQNVKLDLVNATEIWTNASLKLVSGASEAHLLGVSAANLTGSAASEKLYGNSAANVLTGGGGNDSLYGAAGNDRLVASSGNDVLDAGTGDDLIVGGTGKDVLTGGGGKDVFDFNTAAEASSSPNATGRDVIKDFVRGEDKVDLSTIDANGSAAGDASFAFLATKGAGFTGAAGQLRWFHEADSKTVVEADLNGDRIADFQIEFAGLHNLTSGDFIL